MTAKRYRGLPGFDVVPIRMDLSDKTSIVNFIEAGKTYGEVSMLINAAGVSPSQASVETILKIANALNIEPYELLK